MTRADDERAIINEICENPINYVRNLFSEGGAFADTFAARVNVFDVPMIVEVEISDSVYLTIDFWICESDSYHQATYEACTETSSGGETTWKLKNRIHYGEEECEGQWPNVIERAAFKATLGGKEVTLVSFNGAGDGEWGTGYTGRIYEQTDTAGNEGGKQ